MMIKSGNQDRKTENKMHEVTKTRRRRNRRVLHHPHLDLAIVIALWILHIGMAFLDEPPIASLLIMEHRAHDHDGSVINVLDYGAIGGDERDDTKAIRRTLKAAARMGGGIVLIPSNYIFCSGPLNLTSNITLQVDGTLKAIFPKQYVHFTINTNITNATPTAAITSWPIIPPLSIYGNSRDFKERIATKEYGRLGIYYFLQHQPFCIHISRNGFELLEKLSLMVKDGIGGTYFSIKGTTIFLLSPLVVLIYCNLFIANMWRLIQLPF